MDESTYQRVAELRAEIEVLLKANSNYAQQVSHSVMDTQLWESRRQRLEVIKNEILSLTKGK